MKPKNHWKRDEPQWYNVTDLDWTHFDAQRFVHGADAKLLSKDDDTGSTTYMVSLPAGWRLSQPSEEGTLELFIVEGSITVEGDTYGTGGFIAISPGCGTVELSSATGARTFAFWNPQFGADDCYDGKLHASATWSTDWEPFIQTSDQRHGLAYKSLRVPDVVHGHVHGTEAGLLRLVLIAPGYTSPEHEYHEDSWEELFFLSGDLIMPGRGVGLAGTVLGNPPSFEHGPYATHRSSVMLCHGINPQPTAFTHLPGAEEAIEHYLTHESLFDAPLLTQQWNERPDEAAVMREAAEREATREVVR